MRLPRTRRTAAALALAAVLGLGAPVHAAGWEGLSVTPSWLEHGLQWIARLWMGSGDETGGRPDLEKSCAGIDPDGSPQCQSGTQSTPSTDDEAGGDPKG
jgi:hypothetical protein